MCFACRIPVSRSHERAHSISWQPSHHQILAVPITSCRYKSRLPFGRWSPALEEPSLRHHDIEERPVGKVAKKRVGYPPRYPSALAPAGADYSLQGLTWRNGFRESWQLRSFSVRRRRPGPGTTSGATPVQVRTQCLTQAEIDRMNALKTLKRATTAAGSPTFNPDSLVGTWK